MTGWPSDSHFYQQLVQDGTLYDFLVDELAKSGVVITRDNLKRRFLADVLAKKKANQYGAEYPSPVEDGVRRHFPSIYAFIRHVNHDGWEHENLIRELQRQESSFVIEHVAADLCHRYPNTFFLTLHDAIYAKPGDIPKVEAAFERGFEATGFRMAYKVGEN